MSVCVSTTVPGAPLSYTPRTVLRAWKVRPAEVVGRGLWKVMWRSPSRTRVLSSFGTPGMVVEEVRSAAWKSRTSEEVRLKGRLLGVAAVL
jgi:hypothetical protein